MSPGDNLPLDFWKTPPKEVGELEVEMVSVPPNTEPPPPGRVGFLNCCCLCCCLNFIADCCLAEDCNSLVNADPCLLISLTLSLPLSVDKSYCLRFASSLGL